MPYVCVALISEEGIQMHTEIWGENLLDNLRLVSFMYSLVYFLR